MTISFHLPPIAASPAVRGQPFTRFGRRTRAVVTARFLLVAIAFRSLRYRDDSSSIMQCARARGAAGHSARWAARFRFRDWFLDGAPVEARSSPDRFDALAGLLR